MLNKEKNICDNILNQLDNVIINPHYNDIAKEISEVTKGSVKSIIGGGDTASTLKKLCSNNNFTHISTGGGASLELLTGKELPAFKAIYGK